MELQEILDQNFLVSKTDAKGRITYANDVFCKISGYSREELLGKPHNIVRHPDMSRDTFRELWETIQFGRPWQGIIKNKAKDKSPYWVQALIYPNPDSQSEDKYIALRSDITKAMQDQDELHMNAAMFEILKIATAEIPLKNFMQRSLDILLALPWLALVDKGGFMLDKGEGKLNLVVARNCWDSLGETCAEVDYGQCLCGKAAEKRELLFKDCVDEDHDIRPEGMQPHGHYNVPLIHERRLIGVLFLYVPHGHKRTLVEGRFLERLGALLATVIVQKQNEMELDRAMGELRQANVDIQMQLLRIEKLQDMIQQYTPRKVWEAAPTAINDRMKELPSERVRLAFLFCDMKGFTSFSETHPPEVVIDTINSFFDEAVKIVQKLGGDVERFMGDAFFAVFEDTHAGLVAAVRSLNAFQEINRKRRKAGEEPIAFRFGYHTGEVIRGNIGGRKRKEYTVMGDAVNTAARLESASRPNSILISNDVKEELEDRVRTEEPFSIEVKGKADALQVCYVQAVKKL